MLTFRIRVLLEITDTVPRLRPQHGPMVYALLAEAYGRAHGGKSVLPAGLMPLAVEQLRVHLAPGDRYAFGFTLFAESEASARRTVEDVWRGLERHGERPAQGDRGPRGSLAGNFRVAAVEDLFGGVVLALGATPQPLDPAFVLDEVNRARELSRVTLRFITPLRWHRPRPLQADDPTEKYFDHSFFPPDLLLKRLPERLAALGLDTSGAPADLRLADARLVENRLVWLDIDYRKARQRGMRLGGAVGRVTFDLPADYPRHWLVWGQYTQLGESTNFDHGRYRIEELGPDPHACRRSASLVELALRSPLVDVAADSTGAEPGSVTRAAHDLRLDRYSPSPPQTILLENVGKSPRRLCVPVPVDRALQRAVHELLAPALDGLFESSSFAYRRGLSRHAAAETVEQLYDAGYRWAIQTDFDAFFESIPHRELADRLAAYIADERTERLLMDWVRSGDPEQDGRGIPTGYPISPLLANLFLDRFDEIMEQRGGRLVRYADDFLILFRDPQEFEGLWETATRAAESLRLRLDEDKTALRDLNEPFEFLGFRFQKRDRWEFSARQPPRRVEELGWLDLSRHRPPHAPRVVLSGELRLATPASGPVFIVDSDVRWIGCEDGRLSLERSSGKRLAGPRLADVEQLLIVGACTLDGSILSALDREPVSLILCDRDGRPIFDWLPEDAATQAELLAAQVRRAEDAAWRLGVARELIGAKLHNYAALAAAYPDRRAREPLAPTLRDFAARARQAATLDELLGLEGAGAAAWYGSLRGRLPGKFPFRVRVAPQADDPINVMLNIAQTHLYRQARIAARLVGLNPAIGFLHRPKAGFAPLAADFQEPFRMLMDRAVIETAYRVQPRDFTRRDTGPFPLQMSFSARRQLLGSVYETLQTVVAGSDANDPVTYRVHIVRLARSLRRCLLGGELRLNVLRLSDPATQPAAAGQPQAPRG